MPGMSPSPAASVASAAPAAEAAPVVRGAVPGRVRARVVVAVLQESEARVESAAPGWSPATQH